MTQVLEKDKSQLEIELKEILKELNSKNDHNDVVCKEVERLKRSLKHYEVIKMLAMFHIHSTALFDFSAIRNLKVRLQLAVIREGEGPFGFTNEKFVTGIRYSEESEQFVA